MKRKIKLSPSPISKTIKFSPSASTSNPLFTSTPMKKKETKTPQRLTFKSKVMDNIQHGNYDTAFRLLYNSSRAARRDIHKVIGQLAHKEVKVFSSKLSTFRQELSLETIQKFSWSTVLKEFDDGLPLISCLLRGCLTTTKSRDKISSQGSKSGPLVPTFGLQIGVILGQRNTSFKFLQQIVSIQMFRSGCNHKYVLGVCPKSCPVREVTGDDSSVSEQSQSDMESSSDEDNVDVDDILEISNKLEDTVLWSDDDVVPLPEQSFVESENIPGYSLCWDNVQKLSTARYESSHNANKMLLWANCFATKDRIPFSSMPCDWGNTIVAGHINLGCYLPNEDDWAILRSRMEVIVQRILVDMYGIEGIGVCHLIQHKYSDMSSMKSEIVNLGIIKENPSTCKGVIEIMKYLHTYVPLDDDGEVWPIICHGDQLSVERMIEAKLAMYSGRTPSNKLQGLIPRPQNFHKRVILLQDSLDLLYGKGAGDKGTLTQIKNKFGHRNVKKKASECVNHLTNFLEFVTEGHVCLLAMKLLASNNPQEHLTSSTDVEHLSKDIVGFIWPVIDELDSEEEEQNYTCICDNEEDLAEWIECSSRRFCEYRWFHKACVGIEDDIEYDWWCSEDCKRKGKSGYCCRKQKDSEWVECRSGPKCIQNQWFHEDCIGQRHGDWYCSASCRHAEYTDHKQAYATSVLWRGLLHLSERDMERENDGSAMMAMWKINMLEFWENGHYKYLTLVHRLLASVNGWMPERIAQNLMWNSTANMRGEPGCNLPLDLVNEFLNNEFKGNLKRLRGQYSDNAVNRCSLISGTVGKGLEDMFMTEVIDKYVGKSGRKASEHQRDLKKFIIEYNGKKHFDNIPGRHHSSYVNFFHRYGIKNIEKLKQRLLKYSTNLDLQRLMIH